MRKVKQKTILCIVFIMLCSIMISTNVQAATDIKKSTESKSSVGEYKASKVKINKTKEIVYVGSSVTLKITGTSKKVTWSTSNAKVATVSKKGKVTAKKAGTATITAKVAGEKYKCKITVKKPAISASKKTIHVNSTYTLKLIGTSIKSVKSSNDKIATVSKKGVVTGKKAGKVTITLTGKDGKKYKCKITVTPTINATKKTLYVEDSFTLKLIGTKIASASSSDKAIATVKKNGKVTAKKAGKVTITLTGKDGKKYKCKITVKKPYLNKTALTLNMDETFTLKLTGATVKTMTSSNESVVTVNKKGKLTAHNAGKATVEVTDTKKRTYKCKVTVPSTEKDGIHEVSTAADLLEVKNYPNDEFVLKNNIDLSTVTWTSVSSFSGKIDGNGYTISNVGARLFDTLEKSSVVCNLTIEANIASVENDAILTRNANGRIENCITKGKIYTSNITTAPMGISGMATLNNGVIKNCTNEASITQSYAGDRWTSVAGITALNFGKIENCKNTGRITSSSRCTGGIVGNGYYISHKCQNGVVINCENSGEIISTYDDSIEACVGGIAGVNQALIYGCNNTGNITCNDTSKENLYIGGICGEASGYAYVLQCKNVAKIQTGICGKAAIDTCYFNENDEEVYEGRVIIADCVNEINNLSEAELGKYTICGLAETCERTITITRCQNVLNGQKKDKYISETLAWNGGVVECINNGAVLQNTLSQGEAYQIKVGDTLNISQVGSDVYETVIMDRMQGLDTNAAGEFYGYEKGNLLLYGVTKEGKIVTHEVVIN